MITVEQNTPFQAVLFSNRVGLADALEVSILRPPADLVYGPVGGVLPVGDGDIYIASLPGLAYDPDLYLIRWEGPSLSAVEEIRVTEGPPASQALGMVPDVSDIGALIRYRTKGVRDGIEYGTFQPASAQGSPSETRPTREQVEKLISMAVEDVANACTVAATAIPIQLRNMGRSLAAKKTAMLLEISYPEQIQSDRSAFNSLRLMYNDDLPRFCAAVQTVIEADPLADQPEHHLPLFYFDNLEGPDRAPGTETNKRWQDSALSRETGL